MNRMRYASGMENKIPTANEVRVLLAKFTTAETQDLADKSGVPFTTILKIRTGETSDPRLETVRKLYSALPRKPRKQKASNQVTQPTEA